VIFLDNTMELFGLMLETILVIFHHFGYLLLDALREGLRHLKG
jgi:hypothetical protein